MSLREVLTKWSFKVDDAPLHKIEEKLEGIKHRLEFLAAAEIVKGLYELGEKFAHMGEELHVASAAAGITVEAFQKLAFSASQSAISQEELGTSLKILSRHLNSAKEGSEGAQKVFRQVGLDPRQFKTSQEALLALSDRFAKINDPIKKTALAQELLGRNSVKMVGFLSQGSAAIKAQGVEAETLGAVLSGSQVEALVDLEHAFSKLFAVMKAMAASVAANFAPLIEHVIGEFIEFLRVNREILQTNIQKWLEGVAFSMGFVWAALKYGIELVLALAKAFHMEDRLLSFTATLFGVVSGLLIMKKTIEWVKIALSEFKFLLTVARWLKIASVEAWAFIAPWLPAIAILTAIVFVVHELWALLTGKQTWLSQFWDWVKSLDFVQKAIEKITGLWGAFKEKAGNFVAGAKAFFGVGVDETPNPAQSMAGIGAGPNANTISNSSAVGGDTTISAPITVNVPEGTPPHEVGAKVKEGISDHFALMMREAKRSTSTPVAY